MPDSYAVSSAAWKWSSATEHPRPDLLGWASLRALCSSQTDVILLSLSLSYSFLRQSSKHSGLRSFAVGISESILASDIAFFTSIASGRFN